MITEGHIQRGGGRIDSSPTISFRVGRQAVSLKLHKGYGSPTPNFDEGDHVTVLAKEGGGSIQTVAIRNDETGDVYAPKPSFWFSLTFMLLVIGIPLSLILVGLGIVAFALWTGWKGLEAQQIRSELQGVAVPRGALAEDDASRQSISEDGRDRAYS